MRDLLSSATASGLDPALRCGGALAITVALLAVHALAGLSYSAARSPSDALPYLLALVVFLGASGGSALLTFGRHLFAPVRVGEAWTDRP